MSRTEFTTEDRIAGGLYLFDEEIKTLNQTSQISCRDALITAFYNMPSEGPALAAKSVIRAMLMQEGLDHLGSDCPDGKLTTFMDTVIFG